MSKTQIISFDVEYPEGFLRYPNLEIFILRILVNCITELNFDVMYIELSFKSLVFAVYEVTFRVFAFTVKP